MTYSPTEVARLATDLFSTPLPAARRLPVPSADPQPRPAPMTRRYEIAYLDASGNLETVTRLAPAAPEFEEAFSAFARGTIIATTEGQVAVEDLVPGMKAVTAEGRAERITWIGSMTVFPPRAMAGLSTQTLTRVTCDAFGIGRPMPDIVLGPRARILVRDPICRIAAGVEAAYAPARSFVDGVSIIEVTPVVPITVFHLVLERQGSLRAAGLEVESYHPGARPPFDAQVTPVFLSLFPQMRALSDFGALIHPRVTAEDLEEALNR